MRKGVYVYAKLHGKIVEQFRTLDSFAPVVGLSVNSISSKLWGDSPWKSTEIQKICEILNIPRDEIGQYFFN